MTQIFFHIKEKNMSCNNIENKSNKVKLLSVNVSTKNEVLNCFTSSAKMNFLLLLKYYNKIKIKDRINVVYNTQIIG